MQAHGTGGFDITLTINGAIAPASDQNYNLAGINSVQAVPVAGQPLPTTSPTVFGANTSGPLVNLMQKNPVAGRPDTSILQMNLPQGLGINILPLPALQLGLGIYKNTEVMVRYFPKTSIPVGSSNLSVGLWGFGIKHDFKQWIPGMKELPFDLSAMFGYTSFNASYAFTGTDQLNPEVANGDTSGNVINQNPKSLVYNNQKLSITSTAWTAQVLISKKLLFFTPYLGVGYGYSNTDIKLEGNYPITQFITDPTDHFYSSTQIRKRVTVLSNPIDINGNASSFRATVGFRLKLTILTIHADYTFAAYNIATVGVGLNLQSIAPFKW